MEVDRPGERVDTDGRPCCGHNVLTRWQVAVSIVEAGGSRWSVGVRRALSLSCSHDEDQPGMTRPASDDPTFTHDTKHQPTTTCSI